MSYTIVCGAPGTRLTGVANQLQSDSRIVIQDVEERVKELARSRKSEDPRFTRLSHRPNMGELCSELDRDSVLSLWDEAVELSVASLEGDQGSEPKAIFCHLTLFNGVTLEFFESARPSVFRGSSISPSRVVLLIDDIYDMLERLRGADSLFDETIAVANYAEHTAKLIGLRIGAPADPNRKRKTHHQQTKIGKLEALFSGQDQQVVRVESLVERLLLLLQWRRAEMLAAESLARELAVPLTVLGLKHNRRSLESLLESSEGTDTETVYLSHKITQARAHNRRFHQGNEQDRWPREFVNTINELPRHLAPSSLVTIQPTSIDELRFAPGEGSLYKRQLKLLDRWPIPQDSLFGSQHAADIPSFIPETSEVWDVAVSSATRRLEKAIYDEIAFRDHLLVSCNNHLLVYRPLVPDGRLSGGVRREIQHFRRYWFRTDHERQKLGFETRRRALVAHTSNDILAALSGGTNYGKNLEQLITEILSGELRVTKEEARRRLANPSQVLTEHLARETGISHRRAKGALEDACRTAITHALLGWFCDASQEETRAGVAMLITAKPEDITSGATVAKMVRYFRGSISAEDLTATSCSLLRQQAGFDTWYDFSRSIIDGHDFKAVANRGWTDPGSTH